MKTMYEYVFLLIFIPQFIVDFIIFFLNLNALPQVFDFLTDHPKKNHLKYTVKDNSIIQKALDSY